MSAGGALQEAIAAQMGSVGELSGVYDGPPARAAYPYVVLDAGTESDWSHKSGGGREVMLAVTVWDEQPARLQVLADTVEAAVTGAVSPIGWSLVSLRFLKRRVVRDVAGPWAAAMDFRARMLSEE
ncbi:MAG: DUF3168 domain-containing protein [Sphingomicrobium sp.]